MVFRGRVIARLTLALFLHLVGSPCIAGPRPSDAGASGSIIIFKDEPVGLHIARKPTKSKDSARKYGERLKATHCDFEAALKSLHKEAKVKRDYTFVLNGMAVDLPPEKLSALKSLPYVKSVCPNRRVHTCLSESVPLIGAPEVWSRLNARGEGTTIAVLDTGIDYAHLDLGGGFGPGFKVKGGYDFANDDADPMDDHGHGTHCAGIAAGVGVRSSGLYTGVAPGADLLAYKVLDSEGSGSFDGVIAGIEAACDPDGDPETHDHADVISMSLGGLGDPDDPLCMAVDNAVDLGVVVAVAAGNSGPGEASVQSPGCARKAFTVGATDKSDAVAPFSSRGPVTATWQVKPSVCAPGVGIIAARAAGTDMYGDGQHVVDEFYYRASGTSMATPHVAGVAALLRGIHPDESLCTADDICSLIAGKALDLGLDPCEQGAGRVRAWESAASRTTLSPAMIGEDIVNRQASPDRTIVHAITVKNLSDSPLTYSIQVEMTPVPGVTASVTPGQLAIERHSAETFELTILADNRIAETGHYAGRIVVGSSVDSVSAPFKLVIYDGGAAQPGWPIRTEGQIEQSPILADVNGDGITEVIFGHHMYDGGNALLWVVKPDGTPLPGWPQRTGSVWLLNSPAVGDVDDDGQPEIVWSAPGRIKVYNADGTSLPPDSDFATWADTDSDASPSLADIDCDGVLDIVHVSNQAQVWNGDGSMLPGWPRLLDGSNPVTYGPAALGDLDLSGSVDIVCMSAEGYSWNHLNAWDYSSAPLPGFPRQRIGVSPNCGNRDCIALGNLDSDWDLEVVALAYQPGTPEYVRAFVFNADGTLLPGWPVSVEAQTKSGALCEPVPTGPALADVDGDGDLEIVAAFGTLPDRSAVYVWKSDGTTLPGFPIAIDAAMCFGSPVAADIDHDGMLDVCAGDLKGRLWAFDSAGQVLTGFPIFLQPVGAEINTAPAIGDIDNDGKIEIVVASQGSDVSIYCFELPHAPNPSPSDWPMWHHDCRLSGLQEHDYLSVPGVTAVGGLFGKQEGSWVRLEDAIVTRVFPSLGSFYAQADDRSSGIRIESADMPDPGDWVSVAGILHTEGPDERRIKAGRVAVHSSGNRIPNPLGMGNDMIGGAALGSAPGCSRSGLYNIGLLIKTWGIVTEIGPDYLTISDDPYGDQSIGKTGTRILCEGFSPPCEPGDFVSVTGISSLQGVGPRVLVGRQSDISILSHAALPVAGPGRG